MFARLILFAIGLAVLFPVSPIAQDTTGTVLHVPAAADSVQTPAAVETALPDSSVRPDSLPVSTAVADSVATPSDNVPATVETALPDSSVRPVAPPAPSATGKGPAQTPQDLKSVVVKGKRKSAVERLKTSGFAVNAVDLTQYQNTTADINTVLSRTAGVKVRQSGGLGSSSEFSVNGMSGKQVRYFIDGVPMEVYGSSTTLTDIPVNLAERVEVYKGVVPVSLGSDVLGGAVNIISNNKLTRYLDASQSYGSFNTPRTALTGQYVVGGTGLVLRANGYHNYSDNDYLMHDMETLDWSRNPPEYVEGDFKRFHDQYQSWAGRVEAGVIGRKWADALFLGVSAGRTEKDIQVGYHPNVVFGGVWEESDSRNLTLSYRKEKLWLDGLDLNLFASLADDHRVIYDTAMKKFDWNGSSEGKGFSEQGGERTINHILRPTRFARLSANYRLAPDHSLNVNSTYQHVRDESYDALLSDEDAAPNNLSKWITGAAYESDWFSRRLTAQVFAKSYLMRLQQEQYAALLHQTGNSTVKQDTVVHNFGYGTALRYRLFPGTGIKASFEHTYRLQEPGEIFGDGLTVRGNPLLTPEYSDNFNLGAYQEYRSGGNQMFFEAAGFLRDAHDFIYVEQYSASRMQQYENKGSVAMRGVEGEVSYAYARWVNASVNATYQTAINTTKYVRPVIPGDTSARKPDVTYRNPLPNRPQFFANMAMGAGYDGIFGAGDRLQFNWNSQFVRWFYRTWDAFGDQRGKDVIPNQLVQNASIAYSLKDEWLNVSLECNNLTDELAFDNFRFQKPGRAYSAKLRFFLR